MAKVVLITGATRGIGLLTAQLLHQRGYTVFGTGRSPQGTQTPYTLLPLNVGDDVSVQRCVAEVIERAGRLDVLINNAGYDLYGAAEDTAWSEMVDQVDVNFFGAARLMRAVLPHFRRQGGGRIINLSSIGGLLSLPYNSAYAASKFALEGYSESLRYELLPFNIFVTLIEPGQVQTDTLDTSIRSAEQTAPVYGVPAERIAERARAEGRKAALSAAAVAEAVVKVVETARPPLRYPVGGQARFVPLLKTLLPQRWFETLMMRMFVAPVLGNQ
jgi:short-subunit dehydrogenase